MKYIVLALFLPLVLAGCIKTTKNSEVQTNTNELVNNERLPVNTSNEANSDKAIEEPVEVVYNLEEVKKHNNAQDCWLLIDEKVYDVTKYIAGAQHPGGIAILEGCGKENGTELFETRPMGSGTPHSEKAHGYLEGFFIADLEK